MSDPLAAARRRVAACLAAACAVFLLASSGCANDSVRANLAVLQQKQQLIAAVRAGLLLAVDQEKNALLSPSQAEAKQFLDSARDGMAAVKRDMG